jgi:hypothetical protein
MLASHRERACTHGKSDKVQAAHASQASLNAVANGQAKQWGTRGCPMNELRHCAHGAQPSCRKDFLSLQATHASITRAMSSHLQLHLIKEAVQHMYKQQMSCRSKK